MENGLLHHVAIVCESKLISFDDVAAVSAAVAKQVARDFGPAWGIRSTVTTFASLESVPSDYWQVVLIDDIHSPDIAGYHTDANGQPMAVVETSGCWPVAVSHEVLEMLADPYGNRIIAGGRCEQMMCSEVLAAIGPCPPRVDYLVEVCDPVEGCEYTVNGIPVSDFVLPSFYSATAQNCVDHTGDTIQLSIRNGYLSFRDPATGAWFQILVEGSSVTAQRVYAPINASLRVIMDASARKSRPKVKEKSFAVLKPHGAQDRAEQTRRFLSAGRI